MEPLESHVLFVDAAGTFEVGTIDQIDGTFVQTQAPTADFSPDWTHVVAVGPHILFVRNDGLFAVGHIDQISGHYTETDGAAGAFSSPRFSPDWTHVVAVGPHVLFVRNDGRYAVGHINLSKGTFVGTASGTLVDPDSGTVFTESTHVVAVGSRVLLGRNDEFWVVHIDEATSKYVRTQKGPGFPPDPIHVVAVGPRVLGVSPTTALGFVMHVNHLGQSVETQSGPPFASDWTHVVAVA